MVHRNKKLQIMDGFVCTFKNNSNQRQEIDVFESSTLGGGSSDLNVQWNFRANYVNYTKTGDSVYSPVSRLWWDQAFYAKNGTFGIRVYLTDGSTLVIDEVNNPRLVDLTSGDLQNFLNDPAFTLEQVGTWTITEDEGGVFNISVDVSQTFIRSEEHTSELQSRLHLVCRLLLEKKKKNIIVTR